MINLNVLQANFPAADLGDRHRRIAIQVTNQEGSDKISHSATKAIEHNLGNNFDRLIVFFLLPQKPGFPKQFVQPPNGPKIETWDIPDLLKQMLEMSDLKALAKAAGILDEEIGKIAAPESGPKFEISRILKYAPAELIGRADELKLLNDAWFGRADLPVSPNIGAAQQRRPTRPQILTFVALGGEGKTSLVAKWAVELAAQGWPGCDAAFAWSFYSQGTREQLAASSDLFLKAALLFFATNEVDKQFAASPAGAFEKGQRLARIIGARRCLLILDGLEPLQYAPTSPTPGEFKDQGITALLKGLAQNSLGLCVVTTRYSLSDLRAFWQTTAPEKPLPRLSKDAGVHLLQQLGVRKESGTKEEFEKLVEDVKGHALTLTLLGGFLRRALHGDIRQRDRVKFEKADEKMDGGHAFRTMAAYEQWLLRDGGDEGRREVAVLRLMSLFDRPAEAGCLAALRSTNIHGLADALAGLADDDWEFCLTGLESVKLIMVNRETSGALVSLDTHPLLREYFATKLRAKNLIGWRKANRCLYEHLCATAPECTRFDIEDRMRAERGIRISKLPPTLEDLQPLYQAIIHGCESGLEQETCDEVYLARISRGTTEQGYLSKSKLGAYSSDLGAVACLFEIPWSRPRSGLTLEAKAWLLNEASICLRAVGRIAESQEPIMGSLKFYIKQCKWSAVAQLCVGLSYTELDLGMVSEALGSATRSVTYAEQDKSKDPFGQKMRLTSKSTKATALFFSGNKIAAEKLFSEVEQMQVEFQPKHPLLYSLRGFQYCELLLADSERAAWQIFFNCGLWPLEETIIHKATLQAVSQRGLETLKLATQEDWLLDIAIDHLTLGCVALYKSILEKSELLESNTEMEKAVDGLRRAGMKDHLPRSLLTRAWLRFLMEMRTGPESAQADLDEAWEIAARGPMKLFMADIHLHRARLFFREPEYPWNQHPDGTSRGPKDDLAAAEKLINACGYHRRDEELADAKLAILGK